MLHDNNGNSENIIRFRPRSEESQQPKTPVPPLINLPPVTKILIAAIVIVHLSIAGFSFFYPDLEPVIYFHGGFTPASWAGPLMFEWWTPLTLLTVSFLHGGWLHLIINTITLMAFGSGVEKWLGAQRYLIIFAVSTATALVFQFISSPHSLEPVVGISGGVSGFFGALLLMLQERRMLGNARNSILPFIAVWVVISVIFGYMGAPDGSPIAWLAHIGGFIGGLAVTWQLIGRPPIFRR